MPLHHFIDQFARTPFRVQGVHRFTIEPGCSGWEKTAPFPGFIFPLRGQSEYHFNGTGYVAKAGNIIHGGADMHLDKRVIGTNQWEFILVLYSVMGRETKGLCLPEAHFELPVGQTPRLMNLLTRLWAVSTQPGTLSAFQTETAFRCALEEVFVCAQSQPASSATVLFDKVQAYIHQHYADALSVKSLAEQNEVRESKLYYAFQKHAGMGPGEYLASFRLNRARELLTTTQAPIGEIARSVGYSDALYFSRAFHKQFDIAPSTLRDQLWKNP